MGIAVICDAGSASIFDISARQAGKPVPERGLPSKDCNGLRLGFVGLNGLFFI